MSTPLRRARQYVVCVYTAARLFSLSQERSLQGRRHDGGSGGTLAVTRLRNADEYIVEYAARRRTQISLGRKDEQDRQGLSLFGRWVLLQCSTLSIRFESSENNIKSSFTLSTGCCVLPLLELGIYVF